MFNGIKQRIKKLGFISIELVIIGSIVLAGGFIGVDKLMKNSTGVMNALDDARYEEFKATKSELTIKIIGRDHVNYLYDVGEKNLTDDDIVQINGVNCYVLKVEDNKAFLITKDMYDVRFDGGGHNSADVESHVGTNSYATYTYDYKYSTLKTWMDKFYRAQLGTDPRILPTTVTYYTKDSSDGNLDNYATGTIAKEHVFALDAKEAKQYASKFKWDYANQMSGRGYAFWTTAGCRDGSNSNAWYVNYYGGFGNSYVANSGYGARPAFWISLD